MPAWLSGPLRISWVSIHGSYLKPAASECTRTSGTRSQEAPAWGLGHLISGDPSSAHLTSWDVRWETAYPPSGPDLILRSFESGCRGQSRGVEVDR